MTICIYKYTIEAPFQMDIWTILAILVVFAYVLLYIRGRVYQREAFQDSKGCTTVLDTSYQTKPYVTTEDKQGDFEMDFIYKNEGGFDTTQDAINAAKRRFPFDWAQLPPSSSLFQAQQALFVNDKSATAAPFIGETFQNIDAQKILPPDNTQSKEEDILKAYQPVVTSDLKALDDQNVDSLIQKLYGEQGLIAKVAKKANNVYEVYETVEKNPKIEWEKEETHSSIQDNALNPLVEPNQMLVVPDAVKDISAGLQPYARGDSTRSRGQTYSDYNPNLEGIFGSKMQFQQWG